MKTKTQKILTILFVFTAPLVILLLGCSSVETVPKSENSSFSVSRVFTIEKENLECSYSQSVLACIKKPN